MKLEMCVCVCSMLNPKTMHQNIMVLEYFVPIFNPKHSPE